MDFFKHSIVVSVEHVLCELCFFVAEWLPSLVCGTVHILQLPSRQYCRLTSETKQAKHGWGQQSSMSMIIGTTHAQIW